MSTKQPLTPVIGFHVALDHDQSTGGKVAFNRVMSDYGNGWNRHSYTYRVPIRGVYFLTLSVMNEGKTAFAVLVRGSTNLQTAWADGSSYHSSATVSTVLLLNAGERIYAYRAGGTFNGNSGLYTHLAGFLIQKK